MNPLNNPFSPGAGTQPPELAGRDDLRKTLQVAMERARKGLSARSVVMTGLRGVGKTVLLDRVRLDAEDAGFEALRIEAPEKRSLPGMLLPEMRLTLLRLSRKQQSKELALRALRGLAGFAKALKVKFGDIEVGLDQEPEVGLADNGDLEQDLQMLMEAVGRAAAAASTAVILFIDELQYVKEKQLAALITAMHRMSQRQLPVLMIGAGLPQIPGQMGKAKSYAERLFEFPVIGALPKEAAFRAIEVPVRGQNAAIEAAALERIYDKTQGYAYFLQEWGKHSWDVAEDALIREQDVETAALTAVAALDDSFFRVRFDRMTPVEKRYLRAMAELGSGPHRSGDVADSLERKVQSLGPVRAKLMQKGMIWSPSHGDTAFTVPLFDEFMKRAMPGTDWNH
ncbi:MAG: ATP-binding protein [Verrucomicrobiaceae bacterium]|nr:ATP-binding protein [Verrucomicrobiaceae bacterium]